MKHDETMTKLVIAGVETTRDDFIRSGLRVARIVCECGDASQGHSPDCPSELLPDCLAERFDDLVYESELESVTAPGIMPAMPRLDQGPGRVSLVVGPLRGRAYPGRSVGYATITPWWVVKRRRYKDTHCTGTP